MPDYKKMYAILCGAIDDVIDPLEKIPLARPQAQQLRRALLETEEIYIETECKCGENIDWPDNA